MNESVCSGLCALLKGSIKECFRGSTVLRRKLGPGVLSNMPEKRKKNVTKEKVARIDLYADDTPFDVFQRENRWAK